MTLPIADRFGNAIDPACGYAWGTVLSSHDDEVRRMLAGRALIRTRVAARGDDAVFNMTGLIRAFPLRPEAVAGLTFQLGFYARFSDEAETLDVRGRRVLSLVPGGRSHPSIGKAVELVGGTFEEVVGVAALAERLSHVAARARARHDPGDRHAGCRRHVPADGVPRRAAPRPGRLRARDRHGSGHARRDDRGSRADRAHALRRAPPVSDPVAIPRRATAAPGRRAMGGVGGHVGAPHFNDEGGHVGAPHIE